MYKYSVQKDLNFLNNILRQERNSLFSNKMILIMILFYF